MRKITLLLTTIVVTMAVNAQIVYNTVLTDNFETATSDFTIGATTFKTGGIPSNFSVLKQTIWTTYNATNNPYIYTGSVWKDIFSNNATAANKTYSVVAVAETRPGGTGSQCLKFNMTGLAFGSYATPFVARLRSNDNILSFNTAAGESTTKYEVTFWARVDGADKICMLNSQNPNTYLTITSTWQKFTISRYVTGTSSTAFALDFYPLSDNTDYAVYIDDVEVKQRKIAYTSAATNVTSNSFDANWAAVAGATSYSLIVEKSDGAPTPVWTAIAGSPFSVGNATTYSVSGLESATYRYRVTATDGTITTVESNNTFQTISPTTGISTTSIPGLYTQNRTIFVPASEGTSITVFNQLGQCVAKSISKGGINEFVVKIPGLYIVKSDNNSQKVIL
jgi:hypothetical protein